jgi:hypothetical protein
VEVKSMGICKRNMDTFQTEVIKINNNPGALLLGQRFDYN